jgi:protein-disulfide isomerase
VAVLRIRRFVPGAVVAVAAVVAIVSVPALLSARDAVAAGSRYPPTTTDAATASVVSGPATAKVVLEEYGDFQCPVCRRFHQVADRTVEQLVDAGTIRFVFHPIDNIDAGAGTESLRAASASLCASDAGRFWPYHNLLYAKQSPVENSGFLTDERLVRFGARAGIRGAALTTFEQCVRNQTYAAGVAADYAQIEQHGFIGTPMLVLDGRVLGVGQYANRAQTDFDAAQLRRTVAGARATAGQ